MTKPWSEIRDSLSDTPERRAAKARALDECIKELRKADRWRLRKRNRQAIHTLKATRERIGRVSPDA